MTPIAAEQAIFGSSHYRDAETAVPVICLAASSELHLSSPSKLAHTSAQ
jgi:hypothetical protein